MSASHAPATSRTLRDAMDQAVRASEKKKAEVDSCPACANKAALLSIVFRGIRIGRLCRFCPYSSFVEPKPVPAKSSVKAPSERRLEAVK